MKSEAAFSHALDSALENAGCFCQSIESGATAVGIPDKYVRTAHTSLWIELKNLVYPVRSYLEVPFRPGQFAWLSHHTKMGGVSVLAIASLEGFFFFRDTQIQKTYYAPLSSHCGIHMTRLDGKRIVEWIENCSRRN